MTTDNAEGQNAGENGVESGAESAGDAAAAAADQGGENNAGQQAATTTQSADWRETIADPKLKEYASRYASVTELIKGHQELRGQLSERVKIPGEEASDEDRAKFRKALGVPDDVTGYEVAAPEGYEWTDDDQAMFDLVAPIAHQHNMPKEALQGFVNAYLEKVQEMTAVAERAITEAQTAAEAALKREWGPDFEPNKNLGVRFAKMGGDEFVQLLNTPVSQLAVGGDKLLGDIPAMVKFLGTMGRKVGESGLALHGDPQERQTVQARIDEIRRENPVDSPGYRRPEVQAELSKLYEQLHGANPVVGVGGRTL